ncbi:hypothetical protein GCM10022260_10830 [Gaetbulibacter aestuarii]
MVKKFLLYSLLFISFSSFNSSEANIYICTGKYSKKYHYKKDCRGLSNCKSDIEKVTLSEAKKFGRTLCGWED